MDNSIFFSLGTGAKFNKQKFSKDVELFKGIKSQDRDIQARSDINFFGKSQEALEEEKKIKQKESERALQKMKKNNSTNTTIKEEKEDHTINVKKEHISDDDEEKEDEEEEDNNDNDNDKDDYVESEDEEDNHDIDIFQKKYTPNSSSDNQQDDEKEEDKEAEEEEDEETKSNSTIRQKNNINVSGNDIPNIIESFDELLEEPYSMRSYLLKNIRKANYKDPSPIQMQAIPAMLSDREVIACAPTGSGKTAAFSIPILQSLHEPKKMGFRCVIVSPTRELAQQIYRNFRLFSKGKPFKICVLSKTSNNQVYAPISKTFDILITTPQRLVNMIDKRIIKLNNVQHLVFDEADKLFDDQFLEQVDGVINACKNVTLRISLFSATMNVIVEEMARSIMKNPIKILIGAQNSASINVDQRLLFVGKEDGKILALRQLIQKGMEPPVLIFVQSKERATELFQELIFDNINVDVIHSDRTQQQRDLIVQKFRAGKIWVLICTELMARGMDFKGVNYVINFDFPTTIASYIHRIGRTGRAGRQGIAYTLYTKDDYAMIPSISNVIRNSGYHTPDWMQHLETEQINDGYQDDQEVIIKRNTISSIPSNERWKIHMYKKHDENKRKQRDETKKIYQQKRFKQHNNQKDNNNNIQKDKSNNNKPNNQNKVKITKPQDAKKKRKINK